MGIYKNEVCELCSEPKSAVATTTFSGGYCKECLLLVLLETQDAINELELFEKGV